MSLLLPIELNHRILGIRKHFLLFPLSVAGQLQIGIPVFVTRHSGYIVAILLSSVSVPSLKWGLHSFNRVSVRFQLANVSEVWHRP